jgi:hypothetical protein
MPRHARLRRCVSGSAVKTEGPLAGAVENRACRNGATNPAERALRQAPVCSADLILQQFVRTNRRIGPVCPGPMTARLEPIP